uniref:Ankyrin repeat domain-containing protein n=1 Tax=Panagrolaimus davidi TaxID=227884 RepID=A0A914QXL3_9BILA
MAEDIDSLYVLYSFSQKNSTQKDFNKNVNEQDTSTQMTKLHCACEYGNKEEVIKLLEAGANIWIKDSNGNLALHFLIACTDAIEIFELIYEKAENDSEKIELIGAKNNAGHSPLWYAVENKRTLFEKRLIQLYKKFGMKLEKNVIELARKKDPIPDKVKTLF